MGDEPANPPATPPADPPKDDSDPDPWDRLTKVIDERIAHGLNAFFPPDEGDQGTKKNDNGNDAGSAGGSGSGSGGNGGGDSTPPKRSTGAGKTEAKPPREGGDATPPARKRGFLDFLYK